MALADGIVTVIDSHTESEPTRGVVDGGPDLAIGDLRSRANRLLQEFDEFRSGVVSEPRGSEVVVGALIGTSRQFGHENPAAEANIVRRMLERAYSYIPELGSLSVLRVWTGFRTATPDKLPLMGPAECISGDRSDLSLWGSRRF